MIAPDDDWNERMSWQDWTALEAFMRKFTLLRRHQDFVAFTVAGERRIFWLRKGAGRIRALPAASISSCRAAR
ncbi:MAG: hypothetical protein WDO24_11400 [Pseudomonadota bacterium]